MVSLPPAPKMQSSPLGSGDRVVAIGAGDHEIRVVEVVDGEVMGAVELNDEVAAAEAPIVVAVRDRVMPSPAPGNIAPCLGLILRFPTQAKVSPPRRTTSPPAAPAPTKSVTLSCAESSAAARTSSLALSWRSLARGRP